MTTINALRFNFHSGVLIGDEQTSMGDGFCSDLSDKIQPCIPDSIAERYQIAAALGSTGSVAVGQTLKEGFQRLIRRRYDDACRQQGHPPEKFLSLREMGELFFALVMRTNHQRLDEKFIGEFGFSLDEYLTGRYTRNSREIEIKDKEIIDRIAGWLANRGEPSQMKVVFQNAALMSGYDPSDGFQMFHYDMRFGYWHPVQTAYLAEGSGRHSVDPAMYAPLETLFVDERREAIDPVDGICWLIHGINLACNYEAGVGGYYNIVLVDGRKETAALRLREIVDHRSKLASQAVRAAAGGFLPLEALRRVVNDLCFSDRPFAEIHSGFLAATTDSEGLDRLLRGYKMSSGVLHQRSR